MTAFETEESDQLPEEAPPEVADDDTGGAREEATENPGDAGDEGQATGNPPQTD